MNETTSVDEQFSALVAQIEPLESLDAAWDWGAFFGGVGIGIGAAGLVAGGIAVGVAIT